MTWKRIPFKSRIIYLCSWLSLNIFVIQIRGTFLYFSISALANKGCMNWHYKQNELGSCVTALLTTVQKLLSFEDLIPITFIFFSIMKSVMVLFMLLTLLIKGEWKSLISLSVSNSPDYTSDTYKIVKQ